VLILAINAAHDYERKRKARRDEIEHSHGHNELIEWRSDFLVRNVDKEEKPV
jgi:hypothetical protein